MLDFSVHFKLQNKNISAVECDITQSKEKIAAALANFHPFDYLINSAGVGLLEDFLHITTDAIDRCAFNNLPV